MSSSGAAAFLGMWVAMTVVMMLPSIAPALWRYRRTLASTCGPQATPLVLVAGMAYFGVWAAIGLAVYPLGVALKRAERALPALVGAMPVVVAMVVLVAGAVQLTAWKARQLALCRHGGDPHRAVQASPLTAWRHGLRLGWRCSLSCAAPMASLLAIGMMDLRAMGIVTAAITVERLVPAGRHVARVTGIGGVAVGILILARAVG